MYLNNSTFHPFLFSTLKEYYTSITILKSPVQIDKYKEEKIKVLKNYQTFYHYVYTVPIII